MLGVVVVPEGFDTDTPVAGLAPLLRHALCLQAAGASEVHFAGADAPLPRDGRLHVPVRRGRGEGGDAAVILPAGVTCHRLLPTRLAHTPPRGDETFRVGDDGAACFVAAPARVAAVVDALAAGTAPDATPLPLVGGEFVLPARDRADRRRALRAHLRSLVKSTGGIVDRVALRPISLRMTAVLCHLPVTPNQVSVVSLAMALGGAALIARRETAVAGALLFLAMRVVDCVDGELARLRYQGTRFGAWLDTVGDGVGIAAFVSAVTLRLARSDPTGPWLALGAAGVALYALTQGLQYYALVVDGRTGSLQAVEWGHRAAQKTRGERLAARIEWLFRIDAISLLFVLLVLAEQLEALLLLHAASAVGVAAYFAAQLRKRRHVVRVHRGA